MRIMIDTNILVSVILFPNARMDEVMKLIIEKHKLVLSSFVINELVEVVNRKFKNKEEAVDRFLSKFPYEMVYTPTKTVPDLFKIRDKKDYPILYTAIIEDVDVFITGDKDFADVDIEKPEILTPAQFLAKYR
ncbi:putative toxin-antitoxin system toxin component, PIN family [Syntrophomonas wolfei]|uniref:PIN domain-containing protein n=1 Tax=Syntrophomonas wolfei subsp. wolfei (strain DSM 2245B / Goettingen) TaxID=335541 RepID=Q0AVI3_SYNWW|nr:putative toxin-antitoxin system toxin component, PIN family [Syntrophomonas wolfei]ABI69271.1 conserved hypothetical protein [Syntrophomonas wolfei subsp. wolfei str. Goettingen G311]